MASFPNLLKLYRDAYVGHPKEIWVLTILTFINRMGTMVIPFMTVYLTTVMEFSLHEAGYLMSAFGLGSLGGTYLGGQLSDRVGPKQVIIMSLICSGFLFVCLQYAQDFNTFFILIMLTSLFGEAYRPALSTAVGQFAHPDELGRSMAMIRLAINLGMAAAPALGGFVAADLGYHWLFWIDGSTCFWAGVFLIFAARKWPKHIIHQSDPKEHDQALTRIGSPFRNKNFLLFVLSTLLMGLGFVQLFHSVPVFIKSEWGFDERYIGSLLGLSCLIVVIVEMPLVHVIEKAGTIQRAVLIGLFLLCITYIPFLFSPTLSLCILAYVLFTFGEILYLPFNSSIPIKMSPNNKRGAYMSLYWMTWSLTNVIGPPLGLGFAEYYGFSSFWLLVTALIGASLVMNIIFGKRLIGEA